MHEGAQVVTEEQTLRETGSYIGRKSRANQWDSKKKLAIEHTWKYKGNAICSGGAGGPAHLNVSG